MRIILVFCISITLFFGCSKRHTVLHKLDGTWKITTYKQTYINNLTSVIPSEGTFTFRSYNSKKEDFGSIAYTQSYSINGTITNANENGNYHLTKKAKNIFVDLLNSDGSYQDERDYAIEIITKTDVKLTVVFDDIFHTYVLRKIE